MSKDLTAAFAEQLKKSDYLADVLNTQRAAVADVMLEVLELLFKNDDPAAALACLDRLDKGTGRPSIDVERRRIVGLIKERMKR